MNDKDYNGVFGCFIYVCFIFFITLAMMIIIAYTIGGNLQWFTELLSNFFN